MALLTDTLHRFDLKQSDDPVKTDLELTCTQCGEVLCDVEADDNLGVLASVADDHICADEPDDDEVEAVQNEVEADEGGYHEESEDEGIVSERAARKARGQVGWEGN